jgi:hypothetical protein
MKTGKIEQEEAEIAETYVAALLGSSLLPLLASVSAFQFLIREDSCPIRVDSCLSVLI